MNMIEVDPKLFVKCRLCLDETGHYQIVPNVQMQIKYCFDIDVEPFDGLPQLICKKCESILSQYAGIKQIFQEKQKNLKSKLNSNTQIDNIVQQQQDTVSSTQTDNDNKNKSDESKTFNRKTPVPTRSSSESESVFSDHIEIKNEKIVQRKNLKKTWQSVYNKQYICRFCSKSFKDKKSMNFHIHKQCKLYTKYSNIIKSFCLVGLNKIDTKPNLTGSRDNIVWNKNKIIQSKQPTYYVLYSHKANNKDDSSDSSDGDFPVNKRKRKRLRLTSRSSNETVVIDRNITKSSDDDEDIEDIRKIEEIENRKLTSDIECVNIEDSDSASTKSSVKTKDLESETLLQQKTSNINDKMINNIINMCSTKYMNRLNASEGGNTIKGKEESSLKHKILSIGRKVIHNRGINATGLLRYMEHKNLEVVWVLKTDSKVTIKTRSKESTDNEKSNLGWENIPSLPPHHYSTAEDFVNTFERISSVHAALEKKRADKQLNEVKSNKDNTQSQVKPQNQNKSQNQVKPQNQNKPQQQDKPQIKDKSQIKDKPAQNKEKLPEEESNTVLYVNRFQEIETQATNKLLIDSIPNNLNNGNAERTVHENTYLRAALDADKNWTKLLNANPVANPRQLPKKMSFNEPAAIVKIYSSEAADSVTPASEQPVGTDKGNDNLHMPIITSTVSLAPAIEKEPTSNANSSIQNTPENNPASSKTQTTLPKIKVKPVAELMSDRALSQQNSSFVPTAAWALTTDSQSQNVMVEMSDNNMVFMTNGATFTNIPMQQNIVYYPQRQDTTLAYNPNVSIVHHPASGSKQLQSCEYVKLHTVELPNMRTDSPYRYFQKLLEMHNIHLLESLSAISTSMVCLTKFKVLFEQENNLPVKLCLFLYCENNMFCIKAKDHLTKDLDIAKFSANWQWEILKVFKGEDLESKVLSTAIKFGTYMHDTTINFINLLKSIVFSKESL